MINIVNTPPLAFEQIVVEELAQPLNKRGFRHTPTFPLYKNQMVVFARQRDGQKEKIELQRATYNPEQMQITDTDDEVELAPIPYEDDYPLRVSRHTVCIRFVVNGATNWLQCNGRAGTGEDCWWHFTDESDLRRLLRELLPVILAAGEETFDDVPLKVPTAA